MAQALSQRLPTSETHMLKMLSQGAPLLEILNELCNFIDARSPGVIPTVLLPSRDGHLRLAAGPKVPKIWNEAFNGLKVPAYSFHGTTRRQEKSVPVLDMTSVPSFTACWDLALSEDVQAAWSAPILSKNGTILGALILFYPTSQPPGARDLELMEQAILMAAIAIECHRNEEEIREFSRRLYQSQDEERRRIARELHDSTGQKLAVLAMSLSMVRGAIATPPPEFDEILLQCTSLTRSISDELRTLSYLLHPPMLDERGLNAAIQWYVDGINQRNGLHVAVEIPRGLRRLSEEAELAIFRIVQASLTNVHLHSGASEAKVRIEHNLDGLIVAVSDEGQGIPDGVLDHSSRTKTVGIGITGMREKVNQLGGCLEIETSRNGTRVKATIPGRHFRTITSDAAAVVAC
ncbi:MAG: GAF domain-containing sensor histidine kinase [Candidatus Acidiferrales bacterium]